MKYEDIFEKLKGHGRVHVSEVTCTQAFMLLHDKAIKNIQYENTLYELNFIPVDEPMTDTTIMINDELYPRYRDFERIFKQILNLYIHNETICIDLDGEFYIIIIEVLETK